MAQIAATRGRSNRLTGRLILWSVLTLVPLTGYATPLLNAALADTPIADMAWIPLLGALWATWAIAHAPATDEDREVGALGGFLLAACAGIGLVAGMTLWPYSFVGNSEALLLWPVWGMAMAWMLFGTAVTRTLLWPMAYLALAWPPVLTWFATLTQGGLVRAAVVELNAFAGAVGWVRAALPAGTYLVQHGTTVIPVQVSNACSGADSVIAVLIVLPLIVTQLSAPWLRKLLLIAGALVGANVLNLVRLLLILATAHYTGPWLALDVVHPALGFVLFAVLAATLFPAAARLGLVATTHKPGGQPPAPVGWLRAALSVAMAGIVFVLVLPVWTYAAGAPGRPFAATTDDLGRLMGSIPGFHRELLGVFNDSAVLGLGATSSAYAYVAPNGAYLQTEIWQTPDITALEAYTFHNCLLFHGSTILSERSFVIAPGEYATAYRVLSPPVGPDGARYAYEDVEWTTALRYRGRVLYLRVAVSAVPTRSVQWRGLYRPIEALAPSGVEAMAAPRSFGRWPSDAGTTLPVIESLATVFNARMKTIAQGGV